MFLHVLADTLGSVGVIISSLLIQYFGWQWADPLCSLFIAGMITASSWPLLKETGEVLLMRAPRAFDFVLPSALHEIKNIEGVYSYAEARVWEVSHGEIAGYIRIQVVPGYAESDIRQQVQAHLSKVGLGMMVIQVETGGHQQQQGGLDMSAYPPQYPGLPMGGPGYGLQKQSSHSHLGHSHDSAGGHGHDHHSGGHSHHH